MAGLIIFILSGISGQSKKYVYLVCYVSDNLIFQHFEVLNTTMVQIEIIVKYMTWNPIITNGSD